MNEKFFKNGFIILSIILIMIGFAAISHMNNEYIEKFKTGELTLICNFKDGYKAVIPEGFDDETGYFWGKGWSARNCEVIENK